MTLTKCPCCFSEYVEDYEICNVCLWQYSTSDREDDEGANELPLREYRERYLKQQARERKEK